MVRYLLPILLLAPLPTLAAMSPGELIQKMRDWKSEQQRTPVEESINSALIMHEEDSYGCHDTTVEEELLQLQGDGDQQSPGWRYDRRDDRPGVRPIQEGEGQNCRCGHTREEDEGFRRERAGD